MIELEVIVLYCKEIELTKEFYENLGLNFNKEKHGSGPEHYSCRSGVLLELYPSSHGVTMNLNLRFSTDNLDNVVGKLRPVSYKRKTARFYDPEGRVVTVSEN